MAHLLQLHQIDGTGGQVVRIRLAVQDDAAAIASLLLKSFVEYKVLYTSQGFAATVCTPDVVKARIDEGPVWVAQENKIIVGTVSAVLKGERLFIRGMAVDPAARGKRIGRKLLDYAEGFAFEKKLNCLVLSTTPFLSRAIKLYEDYGFRQHDEGPDNLFGTPLFTMLKHLQAITLRHTEESDLDYVLAAEHDPENCRFVIPWSRKKHLEALYDPDVAHLIAQRERTIGYVILAGLLDPNQSIEFRRIVITEKGCGYGKATVGLVQELAFQTYKAHRLWLDVKAQNHRACSVYKACGFSIEGTLRECLRTNDSYDSLVIMSMLEQEYHSPN